MLRAEDTKLGWSDTWAAGGEACQDALTPLQSMLLESGANPNSSSVRAGEKGMRAEPCPATGSGPGVFPQAVSKLTGTPRNSHQFLNSAEVRGGVEGVFKSKTLTVNLLRLRVPSLREEPEKGVPGTSQLCLRAGVPQIH